MISIILSESTKNKLRQYKSEYYTEDETREFIRKLSEEVEVLLLNPILSQRYTEEQGEYEGISRMIFRKFKIYYEKVDSYIIILAVKFPGEN